MLGDYYYKRLPRRVQGRVEELIGALREIAGDDLASVLVHGSVARGDWHETSSDIDLVVVLKKSSREMLTLAGDALALARAAARIEAMILVEAEIARAADVFPLYYQDIRDHHIVLHGSDPFADLKVDASHIRLRVEQELRDVSIRLRRAVAEARGDRGLLGAAVDRKLKQIRFPLRTLLRMLGDECSDDYRVVFEKAARKFQVDSAALAHALDKPDAAHDQLALLLDRAIAVVDTLEDPPRSGRAQPTAQPKEATQEQVS